MNIRKLLGIELPIIQAPMAGVQGHALAVAVSNAGGLGSLPCAMLSTESLRNELEKIRSQTTKPYNVNFFCHKPPTPDNEAERNWRQTLSPYFSEYGIDVNTIARQSGRSPFSVEAADVLEEFKPPVVSFHFGLPEPELLERIRGWGGKILSTATTVDEALWLEAHGVDAIIAQGIEAGGHRGFFLSKDIVTQVGTFALIPQIVRSVSVPVIAAGGIADAQGVAAAIKLGASAVQIGTAYLLCDEATTTAVHRTALKQDSARVTALTNLFSGGLARGIVNRLMCELGPINHIAPDFPLASAAIAPLRAKAESLDRGDFSPLWAGQNVSGCKEISAKLLTKELAGL
ncbi:NAD(P)H-dependent flavin oxidoreductase [Rheinheimera hassiensis]|uniref:NAD(P)H-dependent flavin oxidoreductase n=1 Tax=Rheinheimera hassiensis TaxID=1193627 RepID=UPI001F06516C|nr:nitronate monooxygenase [Rheinheimera hassiensis]